MGKRPPRRRPVVPEGKSVASLGSGSAFQSGKTKCRILTFPYVTTEWPAPASDSAWRTGRPSVEGADRRWLAARKNLPVLTYSVADLPNVEVEVALPDAPSWEHVTEPKVPGFRADRGSRLGCGADGLGWTLPIAREAMARTVSGRRCLSRGRPWRCRYRMDAAYREGGRGRRRSRSSSASTSRRRPPKLGPRRLVRRRPSTRRPRWSLPIEGPVDAARTGGAAASAKREVARSRSRRLSGERSTSQVGSSSPHAMAVDVARPKLPPRRTSKGLSTNSRTLAFSRGRRILHANAGKIR